MLERNAIHSPTQAYTQRTIRISHSLLTLIIRNVQLGSSITRDIQKYLKPTKKITLEK